MELKNTKNALLEGYLLHWYEIRQIIGRGGFGITYLAQDNNLDRLVAIKEFMPEDFAMRESNSTVHPKSGEQKALYEWGLRRFVDEARTLAKFTHPNIVRVLSVFEANNTAYMIMEYAQGRDLSGVFKKSPKMSEDELLDIFIPIMDGLSLVHNAGFIHRDIKPANIYICDHNTPLLLDFGSARQSLGGKTKALTSLVTFGYAPFEQYNEGSGKQGCWTDIYSLGASLYTGITGKKPVDAMARGGSLLDQNIDAYEPVSISAKGEYSHNFLLAVDKALMFKAEDRPAHILECADMLLGKIQAPELPDFMLRQPVVATDEAITSSGAHADIAASQRSSNAASVSGRSQGLIDARGVRHSGRTDTVIRSRNTGQGSAHVMQQKEALAKENNTARGKTRPWLSMILGVFVILVLAVVIGGYLNPTLIPGNIKAEPSAQEHKKEASRKQLAEKKTQLNKKIEKLLSAADKRFKEGAYTTPLMNSAYRYYQKVLKLDADNAKAIKGVKNIEEKLLSLAHSAQVEKNYTLSHTYLSQLKVVSPDSTDAQLFHKKLDSAQNKSKEVKALLVTANNHFKSNRYTSPPNDNAYDVYKKILARQPENKTALKGIASIQKHYIRRFNRHISINNFSKAKRDVRLMKSIAVPAADIRQMQNRLNLEQKKLLARQEVANKRSNMQPEIKEQVFKKLDIEQVSHKVTEFKTAIQTRNTTGVKKISQFVPGRKQFVEELLSQYQEINVKVTGLQLIASKNKARAQIELKDLVDISGKKVTPGNWSHFSIALSYDSENELKIHW